MRDDQSIIKNKEIFSAIFFSLIAVGATTSLLILIKNLVSFNFLVLTYPVVVSCIYVILSKKVENGITILISNTISSYGISCFFVFVINKMNILSTFSIYNGILAITWLCTIGISLLFTSIPYSGFQLGYQRFLQEKNGIQNDIHILKRNVTNVDQLSDEDILHLINPLRAIKMEKYITRVLPGVVTRYNLHEKRKEMKVNTWFLVFCATLLYTVFSLNVYKAPTNSYIFGLLIGAFVYCLLTYRVVSIILNKNMVKYVNNKIIYPFNKLNEERNALIKTLKENLLDRGNTQLTQEDFERLYLNNIENRKSKLDTPHDLTIQNV
ncbi:hypothetical protein PB01_04075 [Psychrobacillus glaciei]|uniref:Uncharacterized protein n=1 Tax=Psychrobacillus glaciei TaxID=2283160 RepID=A0A5J6SK30_9BACI|nr:hypothetical protein [Psychrobacillus glaciei]QFF98059.1 hypothetical protein PB01_04075 [Psychrobacillus glaciei]